MPEDNLIDPLDPAPPPMTAGQKKFLGVLGAALAAMLAIGTWYLYDVGAFSSRPSYDRTWAYCESGDRCTAIRAPCESWVAINDKHMGDARAYYDHMIALVEDSPQMECASSLQSDVQPKAYCLSGLCMVAQ
jgi:hypothetical protein